MTFPWTVLVHDYKIAWIHQTDSGREVKGEGVAPFTVTDFFDLIQNAIDTNHQEIQVVYDFGVGAPRRIYIDPDLNVQDDEIDISVSSYTVKSTAQRELEAAREKWDALGVVDYDYQFESSNGGTRENPAHPFPWNVSVKRAIVNRVTDANEKQVHFELENSRAMVPDSVEVMFLRIELAVAIGAFRISVTYAMEEGYPVNVLIDQKADGSEDSFMAKISFLAYELPNYRYR
ncbi:expressed unknown protein [Seminavis robusta]|uniref:Uncharacterized protein n=1 Tax=Seminavis robusta TaxID=568900 RepID=A0A9N8HDS2_9STRA|nr:expressed unknown protein [Seminavis robusta]|eukprot:Sro270_g104220.1 n/a (232) ;mRNA; r:28999-29694